MSSDDVVIDVQGLSKCYEIYETPRDRLKQLVLPPLYKTLGLNRTNGSTQDAPQYFREFWALKDISFQVRQGETLGVIGKNGSGKSTLLQILAGTLAPTDGDVKVNGRVAALLELGSGFNPDFNGRDNVFLNGRILGLTEKEIESRYDQIIAFADIGDFLSQPVKTYSSGMFLRLAFAVQAHIDASIVIIDEALAVGDVFFRQKCYARLEQLKADGAAILLVSHSMPDVEQFCQRALLLEKGSMRYLGPSAAATKHYYLLHQEPALPAPKLSEPATQGGVEDNSPTISHIPPDAFISLKGKTEISNGSAICTGIALCDESGVACNTFRQGDKAVFYSEFKLLEAIGVPICGILIKNDRGVIVHGKNSWQLGFEPPFNLSIGSVVKSTQTVALALAPGEYVFEVGFSFIGAEDWLRRNEISHLEMSALYKTSCVIPDAGLFSVGLVFENGVEKLSHHGVADLAGKVAIVVSGPPRRPATINSELDSDS